MFSSSTNGGATWTTPDAVEQAGDRGYYSAPAISPDGTDVWLVYNAFTDAVQGQRGRRRERPAARRRRPARRRDRQRASGAFTRVHRGAGGRRPRLVAEQPGAEFLGDYVYAAATRDLRRGVWNDVRNAADCPAIDEYRQELHERGAWRPACRPPSPRSRAARRTASSDAGRGRAEAPDVQQVCPATFGNSDIFGGSWPEP